MDINQIAEIMEQYKNNGGDMSALGSVYQSLTATGKTSLGLNQWVKSDKPTMEEFNEDNRIVDEEIRKLQANKVNKEVSQIFSLPLESGFTSADNNPEMCWYTKSDAGIVTVCFKTQYVNQITTKQLIATLPVGFRPRQIVHGTCLLMTSGSDATGYADLLWLNKGGQLHVHPFTAIKLGYAGKAVSGYLTFTA